MTAQRRPSGRYTPKQRNPTASRQQIISYLIIAGVPQIQSEFGLACCVPASRIGKQVLEHFGHRARLCATRLQVIHGDSRTFRVHGTGTLTYTGSQVTGWDGHLVLILPTSEGDEILDLSLEQANRPEAGIILQPLWADLAPDFRSGGMSGHEMGRATVVYERIENASWKAMMTSRAERELATRLIAELRRNVG